MTVRTVARASGTVRTTWLSSDVVRNSTVTPRVRRASASDRASRTVSRSRISSRAPPSSAPQISRVAASKDALAACATTSSGPAPGQAVPWTSRTTPRCGIMVPFGVPVEPEVYITYASSSGCGVWAVYAAWASVSFVAPTVTRGPSHSGRASAAPSAVSSTAAPESASMKASRAAG